MFMWSWFLCICVISSSVGELGYVPVKDSLRARGGSIPGQTHGNVMIEIIWTTIPVIIVILIAVPTVRSIFNVQSFIEACEEDVQSNVTGYQWWWEFEYPEYGFTTANEIHVQVGARMVLDLQSADVLHAFWAPRLGGKVDLIPNQDNQLWLQADEPGVYYGQCAELCLGAHAYMRFRVVVESQEDFDRWVQSFQQPVVQTVSSDTRVQQGRTLFAQKGCIGCHALGNYAEGVSYGQPRYPDLTNFGQRLTVGAGVLEATLENVAQWIMDPQSVKPGNYMPTLWAEDDPNREEEATAITAFLLSLGSEQQAADAGDALALGVAGGN